MALSAQCFVAWLVLALLVGCIAKKQESEQDPILQRRLDALEKRVSEQEKDLKRQEELEKRVLEQDVKLQELNVFKKLLLEKDAKLLEQGSKLTELEDRVFQQDIKLQRQEQEIQDQKEAILKLGSKLQQLKTKQHTDDGPEDESTEDYPAKDEGKQKRSDDTSAWEPVVSQMSSQMTQMNAEIQVLKTVNQQQDQTTQNAVNKLSQAIGTSYVRWGHGSCPSSSEILYSGTMGGSWYHDVGSSSNYLCLPPDPVFGGHSTSGALSHLYGSEYETISPREPTMNLVPRCAVCRIPRSASVMVPAVNTCRPGWTLEYSGYLMAGDSGHPAASEYVCVDSSMEYVPGTHADDDGALLYYTRTYCGSLPCPPYVDDKVVFCAVCSK